MHPLIAPRDAPGSSDRLVVFVGHVIPDKGVGVLVDACGRIPDVHLVLVGPVAPEFAAGLAEAARGAKRGRWLDFRGAVSHDEALAEIARAAVFVLPSFDEAFPYVILEAMSLGTPIIASSVGAIPEMLSSADGPCGVPVPAGDPLALEAALRYLLSHPEERRLIALRGRKKAACDYAPDKVAAGLAEIWRSAISFQTGA